MGLAVSDAPLLDVFGALFLDIDGVVHRSGVAINSATEQLVEAGDRGVVRRFLTNNASRTPEAVAEILNGFALDVAPTDIVTSAQAISRQMAIDLPRGARVFMVGGEGLETALLDVGLAPTRDPSDQVVAVVQGHSPDTSWRDLAAATQLVSSGAKWYASNTDATIPLANGIGPGNGAFVELVRKIVGIEPVVAGKPATPLFELACQSLDGQQPLMIGDRLDTDIEGANRAGVASLWVATGVHELRDVARVPAAQRPNFVAADLGALERPQNPVAVTDGHANCGQAVATANGNKVELVTPGVNREDDYRAVLALAWDILDNHYEEVRVNATLDV